MVGGQKKRTVSRDELGVREGGTRPVWLEGRGKGKGVGS